MFDRFEFKHGLAWFSWVVIIFAVMFVVLLFVTFPHLVNILEGFGYDVTDSTKDSLFWFILSIIFLTAIRGAKLAITFRK